ncbi:Signal transduction histidine kinase [Lysobacter dokdonensis DS-58]|uniref:Signal transduction histidine kinase n=1 Tax=Lysobacter dokdonensis DS-58 TaxID=1300345 RepID=A0A0A2WFC5_9GAMM|nr:response regulator [Lysobacter dokdonensis]KGQ18901.1 Signal transduction histidine kinase [Lysobacter dokdonensis DS-58]
MPHRILVVDAHAINRLVIAEQLTALGHAPMCAHDAEQALALFDAGDFDLCVVACRMPGIDGFAFAARVHDLAMARGTAPCPIVGYSNDAALDTALAMQTGMRACMPMPIPSSTLDAVLRSVFHPSARAPRNIAQAELFIATSRKDLREARRCLADGNLVRLRALFHRIKGAALMLGENDLAAACTRGEAGCDDWGPAALDAAIDLIEMQLDAMDPAQVEPSR